MKRIGHQHRLPPVPVPPAVAVEGSEPEAVGVAWLPSTAVGDGTDDGERDAVDVALGAGDAVGANDGADDDADAAVAVGGALCVTVGVAFAELGEGLKVA